MPLYNLYVVNVVFSVAEEMIVKTAVLQHCSNTAFRRYLSNNYNIVVDTYKRIVFTQ